MMRKLSAYLSWLIFLVCLAGIIAANVLFARVNPRDHSSLILTLSFLAFPVVGAIIVSQRLKNTVGWIFCVISLGTAITSYSAAYVQFALHTHAEAQITTGIVDLMGGLVWPVNLAMGVLLLFLFPDGQALSRRWAVAVWAMLMDLVIVVTGQLVYPGSLESSALVPNPAGVPALAGYSEFAMNQAYLPLPIFAFLAVISLILRYRRAATLQRQRIKWFVFGAAIMVVVITAGFTVSSVIATGPSDPVANTVGNTAFAVGILALPIGAGMGVLRYQLYDIDILIKRTLVYGSLTAILAALYFALVIGAQTLTHQLTGQQVAQQPIVIVLSTLLIAALVQPLRRRLQGWIDRRFYRSRYDAAKTVAAFSASLRSEVDLTQLNEHLLGVVEETMRPMHASIWLLRDSALSSSNQATSDEARRHL
ncbi:MAG TPA: hypothetical protein VE338_18665 [Ktedonobacterales bacterium]|jgi:hypothetical protein|nr:hypothetical protein [Ktedonobacterales bacterium]